MALVTAESLLCSRFSTDQHSVGKHNAARLNAPNSFSFEQFVLIQGPSVKDREQPTLPERHMASLQQAKRHH